MLRDEAELDLLVSLDNFFNEKQTSFATEFALSSYLKTIQHYEISLAAHFENALSKFMGTTNDCLKDITLTCELARKYKSYFDKLDEMHLHATSVYLKLSPEQKKIFMLEYLPSKENFNLYDNLIKKTYIDFRCDMKDMDLDELEQTFLCYKSDILKIIGSQCGYTAIKLLYDEILNKEVTFNTSATILLSPNKNSSLIYMAERSSQSPKQDQFITPSRLKFKAEISLVRYIDKIQKNVPNIIANDIKKQVLPSSNNILKLLFPFKTDNNFIIKMGFNLATQRPCYIYSLRFISLYHEIYHMIRMYNGTNLQYASSPDIFKVIYKNVEEFAAIQMENKLRSELKLIHRLTHSGFISDNNNLELETKVVNDALNTYLYSLLEIGALIFNADELKQLTLNAKVNLINQYLEKNNDRKTSNTIDIKLDNAKHDPSKEDSSSQNSSTDSSSNHDDNINLPKFLNATHSLATFTPEEENINSRLFGSNHSLFHHEQPKPDKPDESSNTSCLLM